MKVHVLLLPVSLLLFGILRTAQGANILFFFAVPSYSHRISVWPLVTALADRGHNITFLAMNHVKDADRHSKVREFFPKEVEDILNANSKSSADRGSLFNDRIKHGRFQVFQGGAAKLFDVGVCKAFAEAKETRRLLETAKFDLVVIDGLFNDCGFGFAYKSNPKAKTILFGTASVFNWWYEPFGVPSDASWITNPITAFKFPMHLWQRAVTEVMMLWSYYMKVLFYYPKLEELLREALKMPDMPPLAELEKETSLVMSNSHFSEDFPRSLPPLFVSVGGLHLRQAEAAQKVPADMQKFMDESGDDGFIYVSFGSVAQISKAPPETQQLFMDAFKSTNCRFIWKYELERPEGLSANVFTSKWMPQQQILSHPKIKAFVTHGGLMGLTEAVQNSVPVIMFPIFAEQDFNSMRFEQAKRGIRLEISTLTREELQNAFDEIRTNTVYKTNMRKTRDLYKDRPQSSLDTAVWWTEYVLRHDDLSSLKPLSVNQAWYERRLLDVWAFLAGILALVLFLILYVVKKVVSRLFCRGSGSGKDNRRKAAKSGSKEKKS